jgi:hypothetical protein
VPESRLQHGLEYVRANCVQENAPVRQSAQHNQANLIGLTPGGRHFYTLGELPAGIECVLYLGWRGVEAPPVNLAKQRRIHQHGSHYYDHWLRAFDQFPVGSDLCQRTARLAHPIEQGVGLLPCRRVLKACHLPVSVCDLDAVHHGDDGQTTANVLAIVHGVTAVAIASKGLQKNQGSGYHKHHGPCQGNPISHGKSHFPRLQILVCALLILGVHRAKLHPTPSIGAKLEAPMLTAEDNALLTQVGPGTPMGDLLRRYWIPVLLSNEVAEPDGPPVRILGEDLVAFRDTEGRVGVFRQACPHRGASMFFGRNEENGLRCV